MRAASSSKQRAAEAKRLGFTTLVDSSSGQIVEAVRRAFATGVAAAERVSIPDF